MNNQSDGSHSKFSQKQLNYIVNPTTGKNVKVNSILGRKIINSYKNISQFGSGQNMAPEKEEILREYTEEMRNIGLILTEQDGWYRPLQGDVFFEGDEVIVDIRKPEMQILSKGYSNAVGKIVNPETMINQRVYDNYFPDIKPDQYQSRNTYQFLYTPSFGHAITELNNGTHNRNQAFLDHVRDEPRLNLYLQMIERQDEDSKPQYNKSTSNSYDVSFRFIDSEKNIRKYLVKWDKKDNEGNNKFSIFNAEELMLLSDKHELSGFDLSSSDDQSSEEESQSEDNNSHIDMRTKLGVIIFNFRLLDLTPIDPISLVNQANETLLRMQTESEFVPGSFGFQWIDDTDDIMKDIIYNSSLTHRPNQIQEVDRLMRQFAEQMAFLMSLINNESQSTSLTYINEKIDEIGIDEVIRRINEEQASHEESEPDEEQHEESATEEEQEETRTEEEFTDELAELEERLNALTQNEETQGEEETPFYIGVSRDLIERDDNTPSSVMISRISHAQYDIGLTEMSPNRFNQLTNEALDLIDDTSEDYMYLAVIYEILGNLEYCIETVNREELREELQSFAREVSDLTELFEVTEDDAPVGWNAIRSNLEAISIESLIRRYDQLEQEGGAESPDNNVDNLPDYDNDAFDIVNRIQTDMDYMNQFFPDDPDGLFLKPPDPSTHVFFEGDKVKVDVDSDEVTEYVDVSNPGYSNSIGTIVDPRKVDFEKRVYYGMFPEQYEDDFARQHTYPFRYTEKTGHTVKLIHNMVIWGEPRERDNAFRGMMERTPEINQYYRDMTRMWDESEEGDIYTFNKSTSNIHDVSMLMEASEPHKRSYLVEWNDNGVKKLSVFSALALYPRSFIRENPV
jgi:hypothetical protein